MGLGNSRVNSLIRLDTAIFAGTYGGGVYRSIDNGLNWTIANTGLTNGFISVLYANGATLFAGTLNGIYRSTDNGVNWASISFGLSNLDIRNNKRISA
jgi:photosystem II stability/assembly factor-like uncharacterized protein